MAFIVLSALMAEGKKYSKGDKLELFEEEAAPLLKLNTIALKAAPEKASGKKTSSKKAAGKKEASKKTAKKVDDKTSDKIPKNAVKDDGTGDFKEEPSGK